MQLECETALKNLPDDIGAFDEIGVLDFPSEAIAAWETASAYVDES